MTDKEIIKTAFAVLFTTTYIIVPAMLALEQCSTGTLFGKGCTMSENYGEALTIISTAWLMINIVCAPIVVFLYFFIRAIIREVFYKSTKETQHD